MHASLHYPEALDHYGLTIHLHVLMGEDKHRQFKEEVYTTNFSNVERLLLQKEALKQTLRLILGDGYSSSEPNLTPFLQNLRTACPSLFEALLPRSEQLNTSGDPLIDNEAYLAIQGDDSHRDPTVIGRVQPTYGRNKLGLATRPSQFDTGQRERLTAAYAREYGRPNVNSFGTAPLFWCKRFSFYDT